MPEDEIICIFDGKQKVYYIAKKAAVCYLDFKESIVKMQGNIPDGKITEIFGDTRCEKTHIDGKIHGLLKKYDSCTGNLLLVENYSSGVLNGARIKFYRNGKPFLVENYKDGKLENAKQYYISGALRFEDTYENGVLTSRKECSDISETDGSFDIEQETSGSEVSHNQTKGEQCEKIDLPRVEIPSDKKEISFLDENADVQIKPTDSPDDISLSRQGGVGDLSALSEDFTECETIRKVTNECRLYYRGSEIAAKEIFNQNGVIIDSIGMIPDGKVKEFYSGGQLKLEEIYRHGSLNGVRKKYDEMGRLWAEETYRDGKLDGLVRVHNYFKDKIFEEEAYFKDNKLNGIRKTFYPNGKISVEEHYKYGKFEGLRKTYYENGQLASEEFYKDGNLDGPRLRYYDNGRIWSEEHYVNGKIEATKKDYYVSGQLRFEEVYKNGMLEGKRKFYFETGKIMYEEIYSGGKLTGRSEYKNITSG